MGSFRCMFHPTTSLSYSHEEKKGLGFIDGNLWAQRHSFSKKILRYTEVCTCIFERTLLFTQENERLFQLNFPNYCACRKYTLHKVNQEFLRGTGQQYKGHWDQMFDDTIISFVPHFFFLFTPTGAPTHCLSNNIHWRLFHRIRSHSPFFLYQDELLMCLSAEDKCAKSDSTLPISKKNALSQSNVLISDVFSQSSVLTKKCNLKLEYGLTHVKTLRRNSANVDTTPP